MLACLMAFFHDKVVCAGAPCSDAAGAASVFISGNEKDEVFSSIGGVISPSCVTTVVDVSTGGVTGATFTSGITGCVLKVVLLALAKDNFASGAGAIVVSAVGVTSVSTSAINKLGLFYSSKIIFDFFCNDMLFIVNFDIMINAQTTNVAVSLNTHKLLVAHIEKIDGKIGKFTDKAIVEKIERETKKKK